MSNLLKIIVENKVREYLENDEYCKNIHFKNFTLHKKTCKVSYQIILSKTKFLNFHISENSNNEYELIIQLSTNGRYIESIIYYQDENLKDYNEEVCISIFLKLIKEISKIHTENNIQIVRKFNTIKYIENLKETFYDNPDDFFKKFADLNF